MEVNVLGTGEYMCCGPRCLEFNEYFEQKGTEESDYELEKDLPTQVSDICDFCV